MTSLSRLYPLPTPVRIGEAVYAVEPLRIRDLARLQSVLDIHRPHPYHRLVEGLEGDERQQALVKAYREGREWDPSWADHRNEVLATASGLQFYLAIVLRVGADEAERIAESLTVEAFGAIDTAAWQADPQEMLVYLIDPEWGQGSTTEKPTWGKLACTVAEKYGWTLGEIGDLTLAQFYTALNPDYTPGVKRT